MKTGWMNLGVLCVVLTAAAVSRAEIIFHNGSDDPNLSDPFLVATNDVEVGVIADSDLSFLEKDYYESALLELEYEFEPGQGVSGTTFLVRETVVHLADPRSWDKFTITLELVEFFGSAEGDGSLTGASSIDINALIGFDYFGSIPSFPDPDISIDKVGTTTTMVIDFDEHNPLPFGDGFDITYRIGFGSDCPVGTSCGAGFLMTETPTPVSNVIPAPGAALLGAVGLGFVAGIRRRST